MFEEYIKRLKSLGWNLSLQHEDGYMFQKRNWNCILDGTTNTIDFHRFDEVKFYEDLNKNFRHPTEEEMHDYYESFDEDNRPIL